MPLLDAGIVGPEDLGRVPRVATVAGVGSSELDRQVGPRHPEAVVTPGVDHHVVARRHVAFDTTGTAAPLLMKMMQRRVELAGQMTTGADGISRRVEL